MSTRTREPRMTREELIKARQENPANVRPDGFDEKTHCWMCSKKLHANRLACMPEGMTPICKECEKSVKEKQRQEQLREVAYQKAKVERVERQQRETEEWRQNRRATHPISRKRDEELFSYTDVDDVVEKIDTRRRNPSIDLDADAFFTQEAGAYDCIVLKPHEGTLTRTCWYQNKLNSEISGAFYKLRLPSRHVIHVMLEETREGVTVNIVE